LVGISIDRIADEIRLDKPSCVILLTIAALLVGSLALFGNPRHGATASADVSASVVGQPAVRE
jgi:hypothetical protein